MHKRNAQAAIEESVRIVRESGKKVGLGTPLYNLAKYYESIGDYDKSIDAIREALKAFEEAQDDPMGFPAHIAEIETRLAVIEYRQGDDSAAGRFEGLVEKLRQNPHPDDYSQLVWVSGAHMHMAEALIERGEKEEATEHIDQARGIIESDERLKLRLGQLEKLEGLLV